MMDQTHIGYTYWQEPPVNFMPAVRRNRVARRRAWVWPSRLTRGMAGHERDRPPAGV